MATATMPAVVQFGTEALQVELREVEIPTIGESEVLLRVGAVGICGSDVHQYHASNSWAVNTPVTLGHEFCGTIAQVGRGVRGWQEGDRAVSETAAYICGACVYCRSGEYNNCPNRQGFGYDLNGAMTQYVRVPERCLHHIPDSLPFRVAALTEPCCVAYNGVITRSRVNPGDSVLVLGPGPIGLLCLMLAKLAGAGTLVLAGLTADAPRLAQALTLGATHTLNLQEQDPAIFAHSIGDGFGFDVVIDATGVSAAFNTAQQLVRPLGQITKVGWGPQPCNFSLDPIVRKAVTVNGSFSHNYPIWERAIALLASGQLDAGRLIGLEAGLPQWQEGFDGMHGSRFVKAVLTP